MRTYVGDRDGGIPMVFVVEDTRPDLGEVVDLLGDLYRLPDEMSLPEAGTASSQSARSKCVEKCSETNRTLRVVGRKRSVTR